MGCSFRFTGKGFEFSLIIQWAMLVAALQRLLVVVRVVIVVLVTIIALLNASGIIALLKALIHFIAQHFA